MKSKTKINKQARRKSAPLLVETILKTKKEKEWKNIAEILSKPRRKKFSINLSQIQKKSEGKSTVIVPGKVLASGNLDKKIKIIALTFSEAAEEKIKNQGSEIMTISEIINKKIKTSDAKIIK